MEYELYVLCYYGSIVHFLMCDTGTGYIGDGECPLEEGSNKFEMKN